MPLLSVIEKPMPDAAVPDWILIDPVAWICPPKPDSILPTIRSRWALMFSDAACPLILAEALASKTMRSDFGS